MYNFYKKPLIIFTFFFSGCSFDNTQKENKIIELNDLLGNYTGNLSEYYLRNKFGEDMIINNEKIIVPPIEYLFKIEENGIVSLEQKNLNNNEKYFYEGKYSITSEKDSIIFSCQMSDRGNSKPSYKLIVSKNTKKGECKSNNEPSFFISKLN
jgi:hypothetical protein